MTKYTAAEKRAIDAAYNKLAYVCRLASYKCENMLEDGYKIERRERSNAYSARALMVETASEDYNARANTLYTYADGCRLAALAASEARRVALSYPERTKHWRRFLRLAKPAQEAHRAAISRALDAIAGRDVA